MIKLKFLNKSLRIYVVKFEMCNVLDIIIEKYP